MERTNKTKVKVNRCYRVQQFYQQIFYTCLNFQEPTNPYYKYQLFNKIIRHFDKNLKNGMTIQEARELTVSTKIFYIKQNMEIENQPIDESRKAFNIRAEPKILQIIDELSKQTATIAETIELSIACYINDCEPSFFNKVVERLTSRYSDNIN